MRFESITLEIILTPSYFFLLLLFMTGLFHFCFVWFGNIKNVDEVFLKQVDYIWLLAAAIGLITLSNDLNEQVSSGYIKNVEGPRTEFKYSMLQRHLEVALPVCIPQFKGAFSPPDFEEINEDSKLLCAISKRLYKKMPKSISAPYPILEAIGFDNGDFMLHVKGEENLAYIKETNNLVDDYRKQQMRYEQFRMAARHSNGYDFLKVIFGPWLLALALAVRITKVTAEIKLAKDKLSRTQV